MTRPTPICPRTIGPASVALTQDHGAPLGARYQWNAPPHRPCLGSACAAWCVMYRNQEKGWCGLVHVTDDYGPIAWPDPAAEKPALTPEKE